MSEFGGVHGLPPPPSQPIVVPLDVDIEMMQLIADAFRRRDRADSRGGVESGPGLANGADVNPAPHADDGEEEGIAETVSDSEDVSEDDDANEEFAEDPAGNQDVAWDFPSPEPKANEGNVDDALLTRLCEADKIPLFAGATISLLGTLLMILTICKAHGVSNACVDELMQALHCQILPQPNTLPSSERQSTRLLRALGLGYNIIHACLRGCVLFRGVFAGLNRCPTCQTPRFYRRGRDKKPVRVLRHFPLIPRLRRMYGTEYLSNLMTWWVDNRSIDGTMRNVADSPAWRHVDEQFTDFAGDARNLRLILSADGVNPFSFKTTTWSTWPVLIFIANLPPWAMTKKFFILLTLLISGPSAHRHPRILIPF